MNAPGKAFLPDLMHWTSFPGLERFKEFTMIKRATLAILPTTYEVPMYIRGTTPFAYIEEFTSSR